ncbi:MAG: CPCC family cysteine-rich protein [Pseudomonadota bacterium]
MRGAFEICPVCSWEDDGQDEHDAQVVRGGPNGSLSLRQAQRNFEEFGDCEDPTVDDVRTQTKNEKKEI